MNKFQSWDRRKQAKDKVNLQEKIVKVQPQQHLSPERGDVQLLEVDELYQKAKQFLRKEKQLDKKKEEENFLKEEQLKRQEEQMRQEEETRKSK